MLSGQNHPDQSVPAGIDCMLLERYNYDMPREELSEAGKMLVSARRIVPGQCAVCGEPFIGTKRRKYCSAVCNMQAYRERKREDKKEMGDA